MEYTGSLGFEKSEAPLNNLDDIVTLLPDVKELIEVEDGRAFVSLLTGLLCTDPNKRMTPGEALKHPFITMIHLEEEADSSMYVEDAFKKMSLVTSESSDEALSFDLVIDDKPKTEGTPALEPQEPVPSATICIENLEEADRQPRLANNGPTTEAQASGVRRSGPLKRMQSFFTRAFRRVFGIRKRPSTIV
ncbi:homeodomain-interacting protein kinase 1-like [Xyrichtys novacula]|uniref:Homeodomain-interacting protein kinase 1-like n=1 Tax=Xyrichtys novacula TaxID=13765 RepID=A0AAV1GWG9_XYRNO|nr:homeodomain-interacting protein kinase 1-like [Xyrichtys novacula]